MSRLQEAIAGELGVPGQTMSHRKTLLFFFKRLTSKLDSSRDSCGAAGEAFCHFLLIPTYVSEPLGFPKRKQGTVLFGSQPGSGEELQGGAQK